LEIEGAGICSFIWGATSGIGDERLNYGCEQGIGTWGLGFPYWSSQGLVIHVTYWTGGSRASGPIEIRQVLAQSVVSLDDPRCPGTGIEKSKCLGKLFQDNPVMVPANTITPAATSVSIPKSTVAAQGRTLGSESARVTVEEYSDFQCPVCAHAAQNIDPNIEEEYIADGRVKLVFHHMALIGQESVWAAEASECANDQGKFWEYHDKLFENQKGENQGAFSIDNLKRFAEELGLDTQTFNQCLDSREHEDLVKAETQDAVKKGIGSTPTFVIEDQTVVGLKSYDDVKKVIEAELRKNP
jgi:protein-disulfide isomerase